MDSIQKSTLPAFGECLKICYYHRLRVVTVDAVVIMSWLKKILPSRIKTDPSTKKGVPEGLWTKCKECHAILYRAELERTLQVCPKCQHHMPIKARDRLRAFLDPAPLVMIGEHIQPVDHLKFRDSKRYKDRLATAQKVTGETEALIAMEGKLYGLDCVASAFEFAFVGGSMSAAVGERFVAAATVALRKNMPFVCFTASGGARMQEGLISLMQMAKTSAVLAKLSARSVPYVVVLTDPTMGGVSASLGMLGDVIIAEPNALVGFAGPRVIEQTVREKLPEGFQRSEFLLKNGHIDMIVSRPQLRPVIARLLAKLTQHEPLLTVADST